MSAANDNKVERLRSHREIVYELKLDDLAILDDRWGVIKSSFLRSCSFPPNPTLQHRDESQYLRAKHAKPRPKLDTWLEWYTKRKSIILRAICRPNTYQGGWNEFGGKFMRNARAVEGVVCVVRTLSDILGEYLDDCFRGNFYYPRGGYREWHTNQFDLVGWRLYFVHTAPATDCAYFTYIDPITQERHQRIDTDCSIRLFYIGVGDNLLWHSVVSDCDRWSLGFVLNELSALKLIQFHDQIQGMGITPQVEEVENEI